LAQAFGSRIYSIIVFSVSWHSIVWIGFEMVGVRPQPQEASSYV